MIRINLQSIGQKKQKRKAAAAAADPGSGGGGGGGGRGGPSNFLPAVMLILPVVAGLGGSYYVHAALLGRIQDTQAAIRDGEAELARLKPILDELDRYKKDKELLERKLAAIRTLESSRIGPVRIYAEMAALMPQQVWLTGVRENAGVAIVDGLGLDSQSIAIFANALGRSGYFANVELTLVEQTKYLGLEIKKFNLVCRFHKPDAPKPDAPKAAAQPAPGAAPAASPAARPAAGAR